MMALAATITDLQVETGLAALRMLVNRPVGAHSFRKTKCSYSLEKCQSVNFTVTRQEWSWQNTRGLLLRSD